MFQNVYLAQKHEEVKLQISSIKLQIISNKLMFNDRNVWNFEFVLWDLFEICNLELEIYPSL